MYGTWKWCSGCTQNPCSFCAISACWFPSYWVVLDATTHQSSGHRTQRGDQLFSNEGEEDTAQSVLPARKNVGDFVLSKKNHFATDPTNITCIAVSFSPMTLRKSIAGSMSEANTSSMMRHRQKMASEPALTDLNVFSGVGARLSSSVFASNDIPSDLKRRLNG